MSSLQIVNVVATGDIDTRVNYLDILDTVNLPHIRYDPDIHQGLELRFVEGGPLVTLYATGKYIIRASSLGLLSETRSDFLDLLTEISVIDNPQDVAFEINNIVGTGSIGREVALESVNTDLDVEESIYDPDTFPALRCKLEEYNATILLYRSGKVIITGAKSLEEADATYRDFRSLLNSLFDLKLK